MKKTKVVVACLSALALLGSSAGFAGNRAGAFTLNLGTGYYFFSAKRGLENTSAPNFALGYDFTDKWGMEAGVAVINTDLTGAANHNVGAHGFIYTVDGIYRFAKMGRLEPYVLAGPGVTALKPSGNEPVDQANINAGVGTQYFVDDSIALRAEAKDVYSFPGGKNDVLLTAGLTFLFGGSSPAVAPVASYKGVNLKGD